ncbi:hypothetical protein GCM10022206_60260 [Streptomyces chiangmaiensis]
MHLVSLLQKQFPEIGTVLAGDAGDERLFDCHYTLPTGVASDPVPPSGPSGEGTLASASVGNSQSIYAHCAYVSKLGVG